MRGENVEGIGTTKKHYFRSVVSLCNTRENCSTYVIAGQGRFLTFGVLSTWSCLEFAFGMLSQLSLVYLNCHESNGQTIASCRRFRSASTSCIPNGIGQNCANLKVMLINHIEKMNSCNAVRMFRGMEVNV